MRQTLPHEPPDISDWKLLTGEGGAPAETPGIVLAYAVTSLRFSLTAHGPKFPS